MKYTTAALSALLAGSSAAAVMKRSTPSFAGGNSYSIHTTSSDVQDGWVQQLQDNGAKVVRLWATGGSGNCDKGMQTQYIVDVEPNLGEYHDDSLVAIDNLLVKLQAAGIKAIISPHNGNNLDSNYGSCDAYCSTYGSANTFYTDDGAKAAYDARLAYILNFTSPNFGKPWSQLSEAILAFDVQNEPFITASDLAANNDESDWLCGRAGNMYKLINGSGVKIATGGIAGSTYDGHDYNLMPKAAQCSAVDILSIHGYNTANQWSEFIPSELDKANGKHVMIEEFGVGATRTGKVPDSEFQGIVDLFDNAGIPWVYWEIIPGTDETQSCADGDQCCQQGFDGFEYGKDSTKGGITMTQAMSEANGATAAQDWTGFVF